MKLDDKQSPPFAAPPGAAEEFAAALEAATSAPQRPSFPEPMGAAAVRAALDRVLLAARPDRGLSALVRSGVLAAVLPEAAALVGFGEGVRHKDVWAHTVQVVRQTPARLVVRWAGLLHDIGKVPTRRFEPDGTVSFIGHPEIGARMFDRIARRLPFTEDEQGRLRFLIAGHLRAAAYEEAWTDSAVRRFARDAGDNLEDLLDLARADITSKYADKVRRGLRQIALLAERIAALGAEDAKPAPLPKGLGTALIAALGVPAGPGLGRLMDHLRNEVEEGRLGAQREPDHYIEHVKLSPALLARIAGGGEADRRCKEKKRSS
jgi:poly(A) polymerase